MSKEITLDDMSKILDGYIKEFPRRGKEKSDMNQVLEWLETTDPDMAKRLESILPKKFDDLDEKTQKAIKELNIRHYYR